MVDKPQVQGTFLRLIGTREDGVTVNLSFSDTFSHEDKKRTYGSFLLRIGQEGIGYACAYLTEAQLGQLVQELQNAKEAFEGRVAGSNAQDPPVAKGR
jgi:hypothetical protein